MNPSHRIAKNAGILYARMAITVFLSAYTTRLTLDALGADDFGTFNLIVGVIAMLAFFDASMAAATQRFMSFANGKRDAFHLRQIFNVSMVMHFVIALFVLIFLEATGLFLFSSVLNIAPARASAAWIIYQFAIVCAFFSILSVPYEAVINAREHMGVFALMEIAEASLKLVIALVILHTDSDRLILYGVLTTVLSLLLVGVRVVYCHHCYQECRLDPKKYLARPLFREMAVFAVWSFLGSFSSMTANYGQSVLINSFFGVSVNAAQAISNQVSGQLGAFASTMLRALNPLIAKSAGAGDFVMMRNAYTLGSKISFFLLMLFHIPAIIEMPYLLKLWLKTPPDLAVDFCRLLLLRDLAGQLFVVLTSSISAVGNIRRFQIYSSTITLLPLAISATFFYYDYPPQTIYWVYLAYTFVMSALTLHFAKVHCQLSVPDFINNVVFRCMLTFSIIILSSYLAASLFQDELPRLAATFGTSIVVFILAVWFVGFALEERRQISASFKDALNANKSKMYFFERFLYKAKIDSGK